MSVSVGGLYCTRLTEAREQPQLPHLSSACDTSFVVFAAAHNRTAGPGVSGDSPDFSPQQQQDAGCFLRGSRDSTRILTLVWQVPCALSNLPVHDVL